MSLGPLVTHVTDVQAQDGQLVSVQRQEELEQRTGVGIRRHPKKNLRLDSGRSFTFSVSVWKSLTVQSSSETARSLWSGDSFTHRTSSPSCSVRVCFSVRRLRQPTSDQESA